VEEIGEAGAVKAILLLPGRAYVLRRLILAISLGWNEEKSPNRSPKNSPPAECP